MTTERYLCVGGPLDGRVIEHDGAPIIVEPAGVKIETKPFDWSTDFAAFKVSNAVVIYHARQVEFLGSGVYMRVMSTVANPPVRALLTAAAKELGITLYSSSTTKDPA